VRKTLGAILLSAICLLAASSAGASGAANLQFRNSARTLEKIQDATAFGDIAAVDLQSKLIIQMGTDLTNAKESDLQDVRNLRAVAVYLFSGGNPNVAERRLIPLKIDPESKVLLDGALAYARGDKAGASKFLGTLDLASLPPTLAGRVALVKAILTSADDIKAALSLLGTARAFMPGTLVEEGALRRCISFAGKLPDIEQLEHCASSYIRRFPKSLYWKDFEESFTLSLIEMDYLKAGGTVQSLNLILKDLSPSDYRNILLMISKAAVGHGRHALAMSSAQSAGELSRAGSAEMARSNLYEGAILIAGEGYDAGRAKLEKTNPSLLDPGDRALLEKALELARQIARKPDTMDEESIKPPISAGLQTDQPPAFANLLARAKMALADPDPTK
jgi:chemotaxis protein MotC